jgi:cold shock CspA family protein
MTSKIRWWSTLKGYGWIAQPGADLFVHYTQLLNADAGDNLKSRRVEFEIGQYKGMPEAQNVEILD